MGERQWQQGQVTDTIKRHKAEGFLWSYLDLNLNKSTMKRHCWDNQGDMNKNQVLEY